MSKSKGRTVIGGLFLVVVIAAIYLTQDGRQHGQIGGFISSLFQ